MSDKPEIPDDILAAIKAIVAWSHSDDGPTSALIDAIRLLDEWSRGGGQQGANL
jgi:hypothetical protein